MNSNKKKVRVSVVVPVYNEERFIEDCLKALAAQERRPDTVYIVDNNSTDLSIDIARSYSFVTIIQELNQGICIATKTGLDAAAESSDIILRCDADSRPGSDWIRKVVETFEPNTMVAITGPGVVYDTNEANKVLFDTFYMKPYFFFVGLALRTKPLFGSNFAIRASVWRAVSEQTHLSKHQDIHDDIDISYHVAQKGAIHYDKSLKMPISARPFKSPLKMMTRYRMGFKSIFIHWPDQAPWNIHPQPDKMK
jgi:glycosyltransferase involved in cell wall biosynthesis